MGKINVLDEQLSNMIAAGEVVERPASVVKELAENAIDAKATRIEIHTEEGGLELIRVVDNGHGMDRDDCILAFERHATSKISSARDLFRIRTLGFRGEALPSIAAVSRVELISNLSSSQVGTRIVLEGGVIREVEEKAAPKGTEVCVRTLFFNTPARLKYMKSIATEIGHISDFVNRLALTHPDIAFTLTHNQKSLLQTSGDGKLLHVMAAIYGVQTAKMLLPISGETLDFRWSGYLSRTEVTRANRSYLSTLVNGRYIRNHALHNAILRGYHTLLPVGRFPIVALQIEMDPTLIDVNVHPAKLEARFSKEAELCEAIEASVKATLKKGLGIVRPMAAQSKPKVVMRMAEQPQLDLQLPGSAPSAAAPLAKEETAAYADAARETFRSPSPAEAASAQFAKDDQASENKGTHPKSAGKTSLSSRSHEHLPESWEEKPDKIQLREPDGEQEEAEFAATAAPAPAEGSRPAASEWAHSHERAELEPDPEFASAAGREAADSPQERKSAVPVMYPVGQVHGTYIVAQNDEGMYLIDQHAAQERIFYEYFMDKLRNEPVASQLLLFPHTVECTVQEAARLEKRLPLLESLGLEIESFGNRTFLVRAHPHWFPQGAELEVIEELVQFILELSDSKPADIAKIREKAAIMMSCKAAIKANRYLTHAEMESLLNQLRETSSPFTCPHGRPIVIHFSSYDLEKMFKRVM